jgi:hypothetical protein
MLIFVRLSTGAKPGAMCYRWRRERCRRRGRTGVDDRGSGLGLGARRWRAPERAAHRAAGAGCRWHAATEATATVMYQQVMPGAPTRYVPYFACQPPGGCGGSAVAGRLWCTCIGIRCAEFRPGCRVQLSGRRTPRPECLVDRCSAPGRNWTAIPFAAEQGRRFCICRGIADWRPCRYRIHG